MKRGTSRHPKMFALARELSIPIYAAVGILELLWHFTSDFAPAGDIGRYSDADIAAAVGWVGDPSQLVDALTAKHWLDKSKEHRLTVHDWEDHCEDGTNLKLARAGKFFASGKMPSLIRFSKMERERIQAQYEHIYAPAKRINVHESALPSPPMPSLALPCQVHTAAKNAACALPFDTLPEEIAAQNGFWSIEREQAFLTQIGWKGWPAHTEEQAKTIFDLPAAEIEFTDNPKRLGFIWSRVDWFEGFWMDYPRKVAKKVARLAFVKTVRDEAMYEALMDGLERQQPQFKQRPVDKIPHPATWLNQNRWADETVDCSGEADE